MFIVLKRKNLIFSILMVMAFVVFVLSVSIGEASAVFFGQSTRKVPVYGVDTDKKVIALTFDAAWGADKTEGIIKILNENGADGTFFLVGFWIDRYEKETKMIADAGLDIGNHSNNHLNMPKLSVEEMNKEISTVNERIKRITGIIPKYFRAPFGDYNNKLLDMLGSLDMVGVQWSIDTLDWKGVSTAEIVNRVVPKAKNGDIVLFHNNSDNVLNALPLVIMGLKNRGFSFVKLSDLVLTENYYIDNNGIQHASSGDKGGKL
ncbi:MAG TPA: polysaccharide deacetylase family protein [Clostridia bacterium]|nr:polysaccharide deacetylase family protein [Clostridia bacterium]